MKRRPAVTGPGAALPKENHVTIIHTNADALGHHADQRAISDAYARGYCAGETYSKNVIAELELKIRALEIEIDHVQGELRDTEQRLRACAGAVIQLPEAS
jgi:hypothetical protein